MQVIASSGQARPSLIRTVVDDFDALHGKGAAFREAIGFAVVAPAFIACIFAAAVMFGSA